MAAGEENPITALMSCEYIANAHDLDRAIESTYNQVDAVLGVRAIFSSDFTQEEIDVILHEAGERYSTLQIVQIGQGNVQRLIRRRIASPKEALGIQVGDFLTILEVDLERVTPSEYELIAKISAMRKFFMGNGIYRSRFLPPPSAAAVRTSSPPPSPPIFKKMICEVLKIGGAFLIGLVIGCKGKIEPKIKVTFVGGSGPTQIQIRFLPIQFRNNSKPRTG